MSFDAPTAAPLPPVLVAGLAGAAWLSEHGEIEELSLPEAARRANTVAPMVCHAPATATVLGTPRFRAFDVLELFAFARPARFCVPTPAGLATVLGAEPPRGTAAAVGALRTCAEVLLQELRADAGQPDAFAIARWLHARGWLWGESVLAALGSSPGPHPPAPIDLWRRLPDWSEHAPKRTPGQHSVTHSEALDRLARLTGATAEARPTQRAYAVAASHAFAPRDAVDGPRVVLAEAGTGVGKTLGYLAPASVWAQKNDGTVWVSTFTRNLQRQIDAELDRLYPDPARKRAKVVVRKGRENYLCLLNLEEDLSRAHLGGGGIGGGLVARWALASRDGDMNGDFPAWLAGLAGFDGTLGLTDRRGECIYSSCRHYRRCFIEHAQRKARRADLVIANHALTLVNAVRADGRELPSRIVFDEGHHVFAAADAAFSTHLTGSEAAELRRWLRGSEGGRQRRSRGLATRVGDLAAGDDGAEAALDDAIRAADVLPAAGWAARMREPPPLAAQPVGETFFAKVRHHVLARQTADDRGYSLEAGTNAPSEGLLRAADAFNRALRALSAPLQALAKSLAARLDSEATELDTESRLRVEASCRGLAWRAAAVDSWCSVLDALQGTTPAEFVDWFSVVRAGGREVDAGLHRHFVDPTAPFAKTVLAKAHGALITSAGLRDQVEEPRADEADAHESWLSAEVRTGAHHLPIPPERVSLPSPFDYAAQTRIFLVTDVGRSDTDSVAAAVRELFVAAGGGALGLFTAIARLRAVHRRLIGPLASAGLPLLAQHVDAMDTATLVDIFRADIRASLLGTDAIRDGVDVPGESLRLIAFDRVPWPRPDILHRARKKAFGGGAYDDMIARLRLRQAFGRLVRRDGDRGVFVLLDAMAPTRLLSAFPTGAHPERVGIAEAIRRTREFLG